MAKRRLEEVEESDKVELLRKYLAPLPSEKVVNLLIKLGKEYRFAFDEIEKLAQEDPTHRKLFVRGIPWDCTKDLVNSTFAVFGELEEVNLVMDKQTGKTKGYAFVTYKEMEAAYKALDTGSVTIQGREVYMNLAAIKVNPQQPVTQPPSDTTMRKLFVRGMAWEITTEDMKDFFAQYGEIEDANILVDRVLNRSKGSGFITFKKAASATAALEEPSKEWNGRVVHCNLAALGARKDDRGGSSGGAKTGGSLLGSGLNYGGYSGLGSSSSSQAGGFGGGQDIGGLGPAAQAMAIAAARRNQQALGNAGTAALTSQMLGAYGSSAGSDLMYGGMLGSQLGGQRDAPGSWR